MCFGLFSLPLEFDLAGHLVFCSMPAPVTPDGSRLCCGCGGRCESGVRVVRHLERGACSDSIEAFERILDVVEDIAIDLLRDVGSSRARDVNICLELFDEGGRRKYSFQEFSGDAQEEALLYFRKPMFYSDILYEFDGRFATEYIADLRR